MTAFSGNVGQKGEAMKLTLAITVLLVVLFLPWPAPAMGSPENGSAPWWAEGNQSNGYFGYSTGTAGDVNGDGFDDVIVGAYWFIHDQFDEGRAFVYHGSASGLSVAPNWIAESDQPSSLFGFSVGTAGDVNGDGFDDAIVGAHAYDTEIEAAGRVYVYHGSASGLSTTPNWIVEGDQSFANFGSKVGTAGDGDGDGFDDVIVGAMSYENGQTLEGRAFVYHGSASGLSTTPRWTAEGNQHLARFGISVATAGEVNGDGFDDAIVGADQYSNGQPFEGQAFAYLGSVSGLSRTPAWMADGDQRSASFGRSAQTAGDVNGDGFGDVIVGANQHDNGQKDEGKACVYLGSATGLFTTPSWTADSDQATALFGFSVGTAGDVNGDGFGDVISGAQWYDNGQNNEGRVYGYLGSSSGLSITPAWIAESNQAKADFGTAVGTAGDVNGDGFYDPIIGAPYYNHGEADEGAVFVFPGRASV